MGIEPGLPSLPILRSEPRSGDDRVGDQRGFCNVVGGVVSPLFANIYLDRLDRYVEQIVIPGYMWGKAKKLNPEYVYLCKKRSVAKERGDMATYRELGRVLAKMPTQVSHDPDYRRLRYVRYADDFLLGFIGPKGEAEAIRSCIGTFLRDDLKLEMSPDKTLITHAGTDKARFLGYEITTWEKRSARPVRSTPPGRTAGPAAASS